MRYIASQALQSYAPATANQTRLEQLSAVDSEVLGTVIVITLSWGPCRDVSHRWVWPGGAGVSCDSPSVFGTVWELSPTK